MSIVGMGRLCGPRSLRHRWSRRSASTTLRCVAAAVMVASVVVAGPATAVAQGEGFSDVSEGVHTPAIDALAEKGVFEGTLCGEGMFCPSEAIKRSEMAVWLIRALEDEELPAAGTTRFSDVDADQFWAPYVERLAELEITVGCRREPLRYCPDTSVNRGQMATFLVRAFDLEPAGPAGFVDTEGSTHEANIDALAAAGITVGCTRDPLQFCTGDPVRRSQMATFLARALGLVETPSTTPIYSTVSMGNRHLCGLLLDGTIHCQGRNSSGQANAPDGVFSAVSAGVSHTCGLRTDGTIECWGLNDYGQADAPQGTFISVSAGTWHSCGVRTDTTITCWGDLTLTAAIPPSSAGFKTVATNVFHSCGVQGSGFVRCWGSDIAGESSPPARARLSAVALGAFHSCGLRTNGTITCWGINDWNDSYVGMADAPSGTFTAVGAGASHSCGVRTDGTITCWGDNTYGQTDAPAGTFTAVDSGSQITSEHGITCGLRTDGTIACWGFG